MDRNVFIVGVLLVGMPSLLPAQSGAAAAAAGADARAESSIGPAEGQAEGRMESRAAIRGAGRVKGPAPSRATPQDEGRAEGRAKIRATLEGQDLEEDRGESRAALHAEGGAAVRAAREAGLPEAPVLRVIAEGEAKDASAEAIDRAAMNTLLRLHTSRDALGEATSRQESSHAEIIAGAEALAAGAAAEELARLRAAAEPGRSLVTSLHALAEMRAQGVEGGSAATLIAARLAGGASDDAIAALARRGAAESTNHLAGGASGALRSGLHLDFSTIGGNAASIGATVTGALVQPLVR